MATETQICTKCLTEKALELFSWKNKAKRKRRKMCKACHAAYRRQHYLANKEKYQEMSQAWNEENQAAYIDKARRYVLDYLLEHPCIDCGETNPIVLEFDHVRGKKVKAISVMIHSPVSLKRLQAEIDKCEVRCANCHLRKTAKERNWKILELIREYQYTSN